jgi:hypothetical protein
MSDVELAIGDVRGGSRKSIGKSYLFGFKSSKRGRE